jgi:hypothetical protein
MYQGLTYKKIYRRHLELSGTTTQFPNVYPPYKTGSASLFSLIREDTLERKVYYLPIQDTSYACQKTEHLLYDFSLQVGDTLNDCVLSRVYQPEWVGGTQQVPVIDSIGYIDRDGVNYRVFYTTGFGYFIGLHFIGQVMLLEGFGYYVHGLLNFGPDAIQALVGYCEGTFAECGIVSAISGANDLPKEFKLYPNPADASTLLDWSALHLEGDLSIRLTDLHGRVVWHLTTTAVQAQCTIPLKGFLSGVYALVVSDAKGKSVTERVIVQH